MDVAIMDLISVMEVGEAKKQTSNQEKWKTLQKKYQDKREEIIGDKILESDTDDQKFDKRVLEVRIKGGYLYTIVSPFFEEVSSILKRFAWEVGKKRESDPQERGRVQVCISKNGVKIVSVETREL